MARTAATTSGTDSPKFGVQISQLVNILHFSSHPCPDLPCINQGSKLQIPHRSTNSTQNAATLNTGMADHLGSPYEFEALVILRFRHLAHQFMKPGYFEDISISKVLHSVQGVGLLNEWAQELQKRSITVEVHGSLSACSSVFYNLFYSILLYSILSYYRITTHHTLVHVVALERVSFLQFTASTSTGSV